MPRPVRMQVSRQAGFNLQDASHALNGLPAKLVTRPGPWGNPFSIDEVATTYGLDRVAAQARAVAMASEWLLGTLDPACRPAIPQAETSFAVSSAGTTSRVGAGPARHATQIP